jgi:hypothetical protein
MKRDTAIARYLRELNRSMPGGTIHRKRVLEEVEMHLRDAISAYRNQGMTSADATVRVLGEFGPPHELAAGFDDAVPPTKPVQGVRRGLPLVLPGFIVLVSLASIVRDVAWIPGGLTHGQRVVLQNDLWNLLIAATLLLCAYVAVRRSDRDRSWPLAAWTVTAAVPIALLARAI